MRRRGRDVRDAPDSWGERLRMHVAYQVLQALSCSRPRTSLALRGSPDHDSTGAFEASPQRTTCAGLPPRSRSDVRPAGTPTPAPPTSYGLHVVEPAVEGGSDGRTRMGRAVRRGADAVGCPAEPSRRCDTASAHTWRRRRPRLRQRPACRVAGRPRLAVHRRRLLPGRDRPGPHAVDYRSLGGG